VIAQTCCVASIRLLTDPHLMVPEGAGCQTKEKLKSFQHRPSACRLIGSLTWPARSKVFKMWWCRR
jgi:hypothetical protein